jgi:hypothetical protein
MYRAESKGRRFPIGIAAAVFIALAGLGACAAALDPDGSAGPAETAPTLGVVDASGLVAVQVALPKVSAAGARSVADTDLPDLADYYEVIFKEHGQENYYAAGAEAGKEYLSISVEPEKSYDVMLLAGTASYHTLLGTAFVNKKDGEVFSYAGGGTGIPIQTGKANVITLELQPTNLTPDGADKDITWGGTPQPLYARTDKVAIASVATTGAAPSSFSVILNLTKLKDLFNASATPFSSNTARITSRYLAEQSAIIAQTVEGDGSGGPPIDTYTYTFNSDLPEADADIDAKVLLKLEYYAFGKKDSGSSRWTILNGINFDVDDSNAGSSIVVRFGDGSKLTEKTTIDFGF